MAIGRDGGLSTLCHNCGFAGQQSVLKTFPGPEYLCSKDGVVWLWYFSVNLDMHIYGSTLYPATAQSQCLVAIGRDGSLNTLCHSWGFACQGRVLKMFPGPGYLLSVDGVVWLWHFFVNLHIYCSKFYHATAQSQYLSRLGGMIVWILCVLVAALLISRWY